MFYDFIIFEELIIKNLQLTDLLTAACPESTTFPAEPERLTAFRYHGDDPTLSSTVTVKTVKTATRPRNGDRSDRKHV